MSPGTPPKRGRPVVRCFPSADRTFAVEVARLLDELADPSAAAANLERLIEKRYPAAPAFTFVGSIGTTLSHLADNIILLGYRIDGSTVRRAIHVLKTRASDHDPEIREFTIGPAGIGIAGSLLVTGLLDPAEEPTRGI